MSNIRRRAEPSTGRWSNLIGLTGQRIVQGLTTMLVPLPMRTRSLPVLTTRARRTTPAPAPIDFVVPRYSPWQNLASFAVGTADLAHHAHRAQREGMQEDIRNLARQGLIRKKTCEGPDASPRELLTLTKKGSKLLRTNRFLPEDQAAYYGFVKSKEANHDADIYRLYQREITKILDQGGRNPRAVLDLELKKNLNREFARFGTESRNQIAARHSLQVVRGRVPVPDLRIEYETRDGEAARVDLELGTEHYRPGQLADKARAGFSLYASRGEDDHLRRVLEQQELSAEILTL
jgi:hypothetical protein